MELIHKTLLFLLLLSSISIFVFTNPVYSVLYLILSFIISSIILLMYGVEFIGLLFIMVYVGAIAVLFLFVIMMINNKAPGINFIQKYYTIRIFLGIVICSLFFTEAYVGFNAIFYKRASIAEKYILQMEEIYLDKITNIDAIGQALYNEWYLAVFIAGLILLVALIGCIRLTIELKKTDKISDLQSKQLAKSNGIAHFH